MENLRNIDMVNSLTIGPMHFVSIGVIAKNSPSIKQLPEKNTNSCYESHVDAISNFLVSIKHCIPEICKEIENFKTV